MNFIDRPNIVTIDSSDWRRVIRPVLMQNSEWRPQNDDEDINDLTFIDPVSKRIVLPKFFWHATYKYLAKKIPDLNNYIIKPQMWQGDSIEFKIKEGIAPRPHQQEIIDKVESLYNSAGIVRAIIKGSTGFGKTITSLFIILTKLKMKPLIIVHNEVLLQQWKKSLLDFFEIEEDQIGIIQGSDLKKLESEVTKPVLIAKVQSLLSQVKRCDLNELYDFYNEKGKVGILTFDEAHLSSAALKFAKPSSIFATPNVLALSATPFRKGLHKLVMECTVGNYIIESSHMNMVPKVYIDVVNGKLDTMDINAIQRMPQYPMKLATYNKAVTNTPTFIQIVIDKIKHLYNLGHRILVIAANNTMVKSLTDILNSVNIHAAEFTAKSRDYGDARVIVSNSQMSSTGFSQDDLSALVLVNGVIGKTQLIQSIGRILRIQEGKLDPEAHVIFDKAFINTINPKAPFIVKNNLESEFGNALKVFINS